MEPFFENTVTWMLAHPTVLVLGIAWNLFWKGLALWHAAKQNHSVWFIAFLVINTVGLLEIGYLFLVLKLKLRQLFL